MILCSKQFRLKRHEKGPGGAKAEDEKIFPRIPLKGGTEYEPEQTYIAELDAIYIGVASELERMRLWCLSDPSRLKTKRGIKRFIFLWCDKTCMRRPKIRGVVAVDRFPAEPLEIRKENLAKLKEALR